jgi:hypothetical protein
MAELRPRFISSREPGIRLGVSAVTPNWAGL